MFDREEVNKIICVFFSLGFVAAGLIALFCFFIWWLIT